MTTPQNRQPAGSGIVDRCLFLVAAFVLPGSLAAQTTPASSPPSPADADQPVMISPFEVSTSKDTGYTASSTLAGTRMNTELWDTPAAISVFTTEFLNDAGILDVKAALDYAMNTSEDTTDYTGQNVATNDINVQIRGFVGAAIGRNYFASALSSDRFNIERIDFSRGPNSVLFGVGAPGGIINTSTKRARIGRAHAEVRTRFGSWEDYRFEFDGGKTLVKDKLAVRANAVWQDKNDWREFKSSERRAGAVAVTYRPFKNTEIRLDAEYGDVNQVLVQQYPAGEIFRAWEAMGKQISHTYGQAVPGAGANGNVRYTWDPFSGVGPVSWNGSRVSNGGTPATALANVRAIVLDESIHPRWGAISGPGWTGDFHYYDYAAFVEQRVGENLSVELAFNRQLEKRFQNRPQGFGQIALRVDPNALMPIASNSAGVVTATAPNPNVGKFYTEGDGNHRLQIIDRTTDDYRLTTSYRLDLVKYNKWLGRHDIAGLLTRTNAFIRDDELTLRNITPIGNATFPLDLTNGNNLIVRRSYIDFSNPDRRWHGLYDGAKYPLKGQNGVTEGFVRTADISRDGLSRTDTTMIAGQSRWLDGRVVFTGGLRRDRLRVWDDTMDFDGNGDIENNRTPVTRLYPSRIRSNTKSFSQGDTKTFGVVAHPVRWLGVFYNKSNSFRPQSAEDINGDILGNRKGDGEDYGIRLRLLDNRINASIAHYEITDTNQSVGRDNNFINFINSIWRAIGMPNRQALTTSRDGQGLSGKGWEVEITANPTRNWRLAINGAQTQQIATSIQPRNGAYVEANRALWTQRGSTELGTELASGIPTTDPVLGGPATVTTALREVEKIYAAITAGAGQTRRQLREYTGNFFTTYTFRANDSKLNGLSIGGGANYRGKGVVGFDTSRNNAAIYGEGYTLANAMVAYAWKLKQGRSLKVQLNIDNLLQEDSPILTDADETQDFRYILQTPRRYALTVTVGF